MRAVLVLVFAALLFACEDDSPNERESSRRNDAPRGGERTGTFVGGSAPGDIRIGEARWRGEEISVRGEVEGGGYVVFCSLLEGERRSAAKASYRYDMEESETQIVGDMFVHTFVENEDGWEPSLKYWVYCALAGGGGEGPNSFSDPYDEVMVVGEPPKE